MREREKKKHCETSPHLCFPVSKLAEIKLGRKKALFNSQHSRKGHNLHLCRYTGAQTELRSGCPVKTSAGHFDYTQVP